MPLTLRLILIFLYIVLLVYAIARCRLFMTPCLYLYLITALVAATRFHPTTDMEWWLLSWLPLQPVLLGLMALMLIERFWIDTRGMNTTSRLLISGVGIIVGLLLAVVVWKVNVVTDTLRTFMAWRTYILVTTAGTTAMIVYQMTRIRGLTWEAGLLAGLVWCYAVPAVLDWIITTGTAWRISTNVSSSATCAVLVGLLVREYLDQHQQAKDHREATQDS